MHILDLFKGPLYSVYIDGVWVTTVRTWRPTRMADRFAEQYGHDYVYLKRQSLE